MAGAKSPDVIRVLLADDHAVLRSGLKLLLDPRTDMAVVGEAGDGAEVLSLAEALEPDVILLDLTMPRLGRASFSMPRARYVSTVFTLSANSPAIS